MIEIKIADNTFKTEHNITDNAYVCTNKDKVLGIVEYKMQQEDLFITKICGDENSILDGLVRQTMNMALDNGCRLCKFDESIAKKLFELRIIKKTDQKFIDILDFFMKINHI